MVRDYMHWYEMNFRALSGHVRPQNLAFIDAKNTVLIIRNFRLPENFSQCSTNLMIIFPTRDKVFHVKPDRFYVNPRLRLRNSKRPEHIFEESSYNDQRKKGWARFSFHLHTWKPTRDVFSGTTIYDLLDAIYRGLGQL